MPAKRPLPSEDPPPASSSDEEESSGVSDDEETEEEKEEGRESGKAEYNSESDEEDDKGRQEKPQSKPSSPPPSHQQQQKLTESESESESEAESLSESRRCTVKPIALRPIETPPAKKQKLEPSSTELEFSTGIGLDQDFVKKGWEMVDESSKKELKERSRKLQLTEMRILVEKTALITNRINLILEAYERATRK